jgi:hypothetical protein
MVSVLVRFTFTVLGGSTCRLRASTKYKVSADHRRNIAKRFANDILFIVVCWFFTALNIVLSYNVSFLRQLSRLRHSVKCPHSQNVDAFSL